MTLAIIVTCTLVLAVQMLVEPRSERKVIGFFTETIRALQRIETQLAALG